MPLTSGELKQGSCMPLPMKHRQASRRGVVSDDVQQYPDLVGPDNRIAPDGEKGR